MGGRRRAGTTRIPVSPALRHQTAFLHFLLNKIENIRKLSLDIPISQGYKSAAQGRGNSVLADSLLLGASPS